MRWEKGIEKEKATRKEKEERMRKAKHTKTAWSDEIERKMKNSSMMDKTGLSTRPNTSRSLSHQSHSTSSSSPTISSRSSAPSLRSIVFTTTESVPQIQLPGWLLGIDLTSLLHLTLPVFSPSTRTHSLSTIIALLPVWSDGFPVVMDALLRYFEEGLHHHRALLKSMEVDSQHPPRELNLWKIEKTKKMERGIEKEREREKSRSKEKQRENKSRIVLPLVRASHLPLNHIPHFYTSL